MLVLQDIAVKKKDRPEVLRYSRIEDALNSCREAEGDVYEKAAALLIAIVQGHPFASGNRRTAFIAARSFLEQNGKQMLVVGEEKTVLALKGIREGFYTRAHISHWLRTGKIYGFKR